MGNLIVITPEQLTTLIAETIQKALIFQPQENQNQAPATPPATEFVTRKEATEILGITYPTLHAWTKKGVLKAHKFNTRIRYKRAELENSYVKCLNRENSEDKVQKQLKVLGLDDDETYKSEISNTDVFNFGIGKQQNERLLLVFETLNQLQQTLTEMRDIEPDAKNKSIYEDAAVGIEFIHDFLVKKKR